MYRNAPSNRTHRAALSAIDWLEDAGEALARKWPALLALVFVVMALALCAPRAHAADPDGGTVELVMPASRHATWLGCEPAEVHLADSFIDVIVACPTPPTITIGNGTEAVEVEADRVASSGFELRGFGSRNLRVTVLLTAPPEEGEPTWWQGQTCTLHHLDANSPADELLAACTYLDHGE